MKFTLTLLTLASVAYSQTIASEAALLPTCALTCLSTAIIGAGCGLTDYACQCGTAKMAITTSATPCITTSCSTDDALKTATVAAQICVLAAGSSGASSAVSAATSAATSASGAVSSAASRVSSAVSSASSRASSASSVASSASTRASSTSTAPVVVTTNGANRETMGTLMAGAAMLAAFAL